MNKLAKLLKRINYKSMKEEIRGYGFEYSLGQYLATVVIVLSILVGTSFFFRLQIQFILLIVLVGLLSLPVIILSQIMNLYHLKKFEEMTNYMNQTLVSFKIHPKIINALRDSRELSDGVLRDKIDEAIKYIENDINGVDTYERALEIIEREYPNSRVHAMHKMMITVEYENSQNYLLSSDDLFADIEAWTERTYVYQNDLKMTKSKVVMSIVLALMISLVMVIGLPEQLLMFTDNILYQIVTSLVILVSLAIYCFLQTRLNGEWLLYDIDFKKRERVYRDIDYIRNYDYVNANKTKWIKCFMFLPITILGVVMGEAYVVMLGLLLMVFGFFQNNMVYKSKKRRVEREIKTEFPLWLRDISLNLHNYVVTRAIKNSYETAPYVLQPYLAEFIDDMERNPNSIQPYTDFLSDFNLSEVKNAMRCLYSIKLLGDIDAQRQISNLILQNQKMLAAAERLRNEDSLAGVSFISLLPILMASLSLIVNMILIIMEFISIAMSAGAIG